MKTITIFGPTIVKVGSEQAVRHPYEGPLTVSNKEAERLAEAGVLAADPENAEGDDPVEPEPEPSE